MVAVGIPDSHGNISTANACQFVLAAGRRHKFLKMYEGYDYIFLRLRLFRVI